MPSVLPHDTRERIERVSFTRIERRPTPTPRPSPTPTPVPVHRFVVHTHPQGKAARAELIKHLGASRPRVPKVTLASLSPAPLSTGGEGAGSGNGAGAGSLGNGTNGNGTGDAGNGSGSAPCGDVDFSAVGEATYNATTGFYERSNVVAIVHFEDGTTQSVPLDWTWRFKSEDFDPFKTTDAPMFFQPPPLAQRATEPPAVQFIMKYTQNGRSKLEDCPPAR